jgi:2-oxoisovalerate dehydrogenase E1 component
MLGRELLESMLLGRHLDRAAHELRAQGHGQYTICSSGHEANVVLGRLTTPSDPTLLHYRSVAAQIERARHVPGVDAVRDIALSLVASSEDPLCSGRHKLFGSKALGIVPQTSTIASHLPRAVGMAYALELRPRLGILPHAPRDTIAVASFGDASINHSTALGAFNAASWSLHQNLKLPLLFVCEDNGLGISVRTPEGWVETRLRSLPHIRYFACDSVDLEQCYRNTASAIDYCRRSRKTAVLHLRCDRLLGHAGSDVDSAYRSAEQIETTLERDPVLCFALSLIRAGVLERRAVLALDSEAGARVQAEAERATLRPKLDSRAQVMEAIVRPVALGFAAPSSQPSKAPLTLAQGINSALHELLEQHREVVLFGEDVAKKGGVYGVTKGLHAVFGARRVFNTLLDEQTILGLSLGMSTLGLLPIPEIQYLAYLHNAEDQLRGEAATMSFFSNASFTNPMLIRIAGLGYQKGFGGHFHNDNSLTVLRDIPGLSVVVPTRADDAIALYRTAFELARGFGRVIVAVEPIALYHQRDLHENGDGGWLAAAGTGAAELGRVRAYGEGAADLTIASYGNGVYLSLRAARRLERTRGVKVRVLDLRWLVPLPIDDFLEHARQSPRLLFVDECRRSGNVSEAVAAALLDARVSLRFSRIASADSFIPLGSASELVLVSEQEIMDAALALLEARA